MPDTLAPELSAWVEQAVGRRVAAAARHSGGNRHGTWALRLRGPDGGEHDAFLKVGGGDDEGDPTPLAREAAAYRALDGASLPVPRLLAARQGCTDPARGQGQSACRHDLVLVTRVPGTTDLPPAGAPDRAAVVIDLMRRLAALHAVAPDELDLGCLGPPGRRRRLVAAELARWERRYRRSKRLDPLIECGLAWCVANVPPDDRPAVLLHGDAGPGNFLHDGGVVQGLVDWELAHLGDPMEDLAAFSLRMVHGGLDGFETLVEAYGEAAAERVDPVRLAYHQVLAALRVVILRHVAADVVADPRVAQRLISRVLHRRLLIEALHTATGRPRPTPLVPPDRVTPQTRLYEAAADLLRHAVLPGATPVAAEATKAVARIVKHLGEVDRLGTTADAAGVAALRGVLGAHGDDRPLTALCDTLAERLRDRVLAPEEALPALAVTQASETALLRPALGALADRPLPGLSPRATSPDPTGAST